MIAFAFLSTSNYFFFPSTGLVARTNPRGAFCVCVTAERRRVVYGPTLEFWLHFLGGFGSERSGTR